ncbi:MAG: DUF4249 domain-containing protein [Bacteroidota bacterium]
MQTIKYIPQFLAFVLFLSLFGACQDVIDVDLEEGETEVVIDAWLNNLSTPQVIKLRQTSPYFSNVAAPIITGASVIVSDSDGNQFTFLDDDNNGNYVWTPNPGERFGEIGKSYDLAVRINELEYTASTIMNRVPAIDSITLEDREPELGRPEGIYAEFFSRDFEGPGDCYWIKTYKNGGFLNKPQEINIAYDAGFTAGSQIDGLIFIPPIREAMNRVPDSGDDAVDNNDLPPWAIGDSINVELHSISEDAFFYMEQTREQLTLGDAAIFAEPPANVPTNISCSDSNEKPQGFFNVAAVSTLGRVVEL